VWRPLTPAFVWGPVLLGGAFRFTAELKLTRGAAGGRCQIRNPKRGVGIQRRLGPRAGVCHRHDIRAAPVMTGSRAGRQCHCDRGLMFTSAPRKTPRPLGERALEGRVSVKGTLGLSGPALSGGRGYAWPRLIAWSLGSQGFKEGDAGHKMTLCPNRAATPPPCAATILGKRRGCRGVRNACTDVLPRFACPPS
jgi:hypothetical protein